MQPFLCMKKQKLGGNIKKENPNLILWVPYCSQTSHVTEQYQYLRSLLILRCSARKSCSVIIGLKLPPHSKVFRWWLPYCVPLKISQHCNGSKTVYSVNTIHLILNITAFPRMVLGCWHTMLIVNQMVMRGNYWISALYCVTHLDSQ